MPSVNIYIMSHKATVTVYYGFFKLESLKNE